LQGPQGSPPDEGVDHGRRAVQRLASSLLQICYPCLFCQELTTLWVARLDDGAELKVADPKEQQRDVEEEEAEGKKRQDGVNCGAGC